MGKFKSKYREEETYLKELARLYQKDSPPYTLREESYYPLLLNFFKTKGLSAVQFPAKTEGGFPDIRVSEKEGYIIGYVECKKPEEDLKNHKDSPQLKRYREHFKNLLLTNFVSFVHFVNGEKVAEIQFISPEDLKKGNLSTANFEAFSELIAEFINFRVSPIKTIEELAASLAWRVRLLKEELFKELQKRESLKDLFSLLKEYIIHTLTEEEFADAIAQSLTYALLIIRSEKEIVQKTDVLLKIPEYLSIIRDIFLEVLKIEGRELNWILDEIEDTLNLFDPASARLTPEELATHFYETFLSAYNPSLREIRGVFYTPKPVVKFIVKSLKEALKNYFSLRGVSDERVKLLEPAGGTLTFVMEILSEVKKEIEKSLGSGALSEYFKSVVLKNFFAFELLPAPYVIGHLRVGEFLKNLGLSKERFNYFLTNALEFEHKIADWLFSREWAKDIQIADKIKREEKILVVIGNPPYSGISANNTKEINAFVKEDKDGCQSYYKVDGKGLGEKNPKWLQDDYVKFLRFAQWKIHKGGEGIVGFITNHAYIDNPTFRGMRQSLLKTFDKIYILDLHGNKRKKEPDENVFDIQQGTAIGIFIKDGSKKGEYAEVYYYSTLKNKGILKREEKFSFLEENTIFTIPWKKVTSESPYYFFKSVSFDQEYQKFLRINEIFEVYSVGVVTGKDKLFIDFKKQILIDKVTKELNLNKNEVEKCVVKILYRPFDFRYIFYNPAYIERARKQVMSHMLKGENLGLVTARSDKTGKATSALATEHISEAKTGESTTQSYLFPLYLYTKSGKVPNFTERFQSYLKQLYCEMPSPEEVFYYIYGVLYSPSYRQRYGEFLKYDFPRIPFPKDFLSFKEIAGFGKRLVELHLLKDSYLNEFSAKFLGKGRTKVEKLIYIESEERLFINSTQYFYPVKKEVWEYYIGGYQVLKKWLSARKGKNLTWEEITTFLKIIKAIEETIKVEKLLSS